MSAMGTRNQRTLWKDVRYAGHVRLGRTDWTRSPYFVAHASRVPLPIHKKIDSAPVLTATRQMVRDILDDARSHRPLAPVRGAWEREAYPDHPLIALAPAGQGLMNPQREVVLVGFEPHLFTPLHQHLHEIDGCELRGDPWKGRCSWWHAGHPVAVLAGLIGRPIKVQP